MRTRFGICVKKVRYQTLRDAELAGRNAPFSLRPYRCDLCRDFHLTSRTKGMFVSRSPISGNGDKVAP